jgi:hypothetical protein
VKRNFRFWTFLSSNKISTDLFYKETDSHQYLLFNSCHPSHTKRNIPFNLARRICTIVTNEELRTKRLIELTTYLQRKKYPLDLITEAIRKAKQIPITELRKVNRKTYSKTLPTEIPFVITNNPRNHNIFNTTRNCFPIIQQSENLKDIINQKEIIYCRKQPPNLKKLLTKAKFTSREEIFTVSKCEDPRCGTCDFLRTGNSITFKNGTKFTVRSNVNCKTKNVIYCMICKLCGENYIGQTGKK